MLNNNVYYHGIVRKAIIGFGRLFSNVKIQRKLGDPVQGTDEQLIHVPLAYAPKEKWMVRVDEDPDQENYTQTSLPRMSFEIIAYTYDSLRKINRMETVRNNQVLTDASTKMKYSRTPVPYNIDMSLYIITKTQEDALQILEQILPTFTPEYTMSLNAIDELGLQLDVPVVLNSVIVSDEYEGDFQTRRYVIHTINFQMKLNLFGPVNDGKIIKKTISNIWHNEAMGAAGDDTAAIHISEGDPDTLTITRDEWLNEF